MKKQPKPRDFSTDLTGVTLRSFDRHSVDILRIKGATVALVNNVLQLPVVSCLDEDNRPCAYENAVQCTAGTEKLGFIVVRFACDGPYTGRLN